MILNVDDSTKYMSQSQRKGQRKRLNRRTPFMNPCYTRTCYEKSCRAFENIGSTYLSNLPGIGSLYHVFTLSAIDFTLFLSLAFLMHASSSQTLPWSSSLTAKENEKLTHLTKCHRNSCLQSSPTVALYRYHR